MNRDQMIAHLSLLGWELRVHHHPPAEYRLVHPALRHNVTEWADVTTHSRYHYSWGGDQVAHLWPPADWRDISDNLLRDMFAIVEAENGP